MTAKLDKTIRRELELDGKLYTIAIGPEGLKVTEKGRRNGPELSWRSIVSGDATLNENLKISVDASDPSNEERGPRPLARRSRSPETSKSPRSVSQPLGGVRRRADRCRARVARAGALGASRLVRGPPDRCVFRRAAPSRPPPPVVPPAPRRASTT